MLTELQGARKVVGVKQLRKCLANGSVAKVFLAQDAEDRITRSVAEACQEQNVNIEPVPTMAELGAACGIEVGAAMAGLLK